MYPMDTVLSHEAIGEEAMQQTLEGHMTNDNMKNVVCPKHTYTTLHRMLECYE